MRKLIDTPCESKINTVAEEHVSSENIYFDIDVDDEVEFSVSSSQQTAEQTVQQKVIQEVILLKVPELNGSVMKQMITRSNSFFSVKKTPDR